MAHGFIGSLADDGHVETATDHGGDIFERHAFFGDCMIPGSRNDAVFEREPVDARGVEPMHRRPAGEPLADVGRCAFFAGNADEDRCEAVVAFAMDRGSKPDHRCAHATGGE